MVSPLTLNLYAMKKPSTQASLVAGCPIKSLS